MQSLLIPRKSALPGNYSAAEKKKGGGGEKKDKKEKREKRALSDYYTTVPVKQREAKKTNRILLPRSS